MNTDPTQNSPADDMDRLLAAHFASDQQLAPSSGFAFSVMDSIQAEATALPPIPFPWRRVAPGLVAVLGLLIAAVIFTIRELRSIPDTGSGIEQALLRPISLSAIHLSTLEQALCWIAASACISLLAAAASFRLAQK